MSARGSLGTLLLLLLAGSGAADSNGPSRSVDLLRLIDHAKDAVLGVWTFEGRALVTPSLAFGRIVIPYEPPEEYDIVAVVERRGKGNSFNLGLAQGTRQFSVILDGIADAPKSGLELIDRRGFYGNETTVEGRLIEARTPTRVICRVRRGGVSVWVGDRKVVDWSGDFKRLSLYPDWSIPQERALFVGSWQGCDNRIHRLDLTPVRGGGKRLR